MKNKYEYKVLQSNSLISAEQLNELSQKEGWNLVNIVVIEFNYFFYFKKKI